MSDFAEQYKQWIEDKVCYSCGAKATAFVADTREIGEPRRDKNGLLWPTSAVVSFTFVCNEHRRESVLFRKSK